MESKRALGEGRYWMHGLLYAEEGGTLLLLGAPGAVRLDLSPVCFRGLRVLGTYTYGQADFRRAVELLSEGEGLENLVTHVFPLRDWRLAIRTILSHRGIKVAFRPWR